MVLSGKIIMYKLRQRKRKKMVERNKSKESLVNKVTAKWVRTIQAGSHFGDQGLVKEKMNPQAPDWISNRRERG